TAAAPQQLLPSCQEEDTARFRVAADRTLRKSAVPLPQIARLRKTPHPGRPASLPNLRVPRLPWKILRLPRQLLGATAAPHPTRNNFLHSDRSAQLFRIRLPRQRGRRFFLSYRPGRDKYRRRSCSAIYLLPNSPSTPQSLLPDPRWFAHSPSIRATPPNSSQ